MKRHGDVQTVMKRCVVPCLLVLCWIPYHPVPHFQDHTITIKIIAINTMKCRLYESCREDDATMLDSSTNVQAVAEQQSEQPFLEQPTQVGTGYSASIFSMLQQLENLSLTNKDTSVDPFGIARHEGEDMDMCRAEEHPVLYRAANNRGPSIGAYYCSNGLLSQDTGDTNIESSFMCDKCGCIISRARMEQHYLYWCESLS